MADPVNTSASQGSNQQNFDAQVLDDLTVLQQTGGTTETPGGAQSDVSERVVNEGDKDDPSLLHEPPAKVAQASGLQGGQHSVVDTVLAGGVIEASQGRTPVPPSGGAPTSASSATESAAAGAMAGTAAAEPVPATNALAQAVADQPVASGASEAPTQAATPRAGVVGTETVATDNTAETAGSSTTTQMDVGTVSDPTNTPAPTPGSTPASVVDVVPAPVGESATVPAPEPTHANNGFGNGDQAAPGQSATHNHAENAATTGDTNEGGSAHAGGSAANNGFGNGDQAAPGQSATHNHAENDVNTSHPNASEVAHTADAPAFQGDELDLAVLLPQGNSAADTHAYVAVMSDAETHSPMAVDSGQGGEHASWVEAANNAQAPTVESGHAFDSTAETINFSDAHGGGHNWEVQDTHDHGHGHS